MVVLEDVPETVKQTLFENWNLHGSLSKGVLGEDGFNTGIPAPSRTYPSIEITPVDRRSIILSVEWWQLDELVHVHIWVRPRTIDKKALAKAKNERRYLVQEVWRIIHKMCVSMTDIQWTLPDIELNADQYHALESDVSERQESTAPVSRGAFFPILHTIIAIRARQFHHKYEGGIAVNR